MNVQELIDRLTALRGEHGDLEVYLRDPLEGNSYEVNGARFVNTGINEFGERFWDDLIEITLLDGCSEENDNEEGGGWWVK